MRSKCVEVRRKGKVVTRGKTMAVFLAILLVSAMVPVSALALDSEPAPQTGWDVLRAYALEATDDPAVAEEIDTAEEIYGRDLTAEEVEIRKRGIDANAVADKAIEEARGLTSEELDTIRESAEAAFGTPEEIRAGAEQAMREKYPAPPPTQIIDLSKTAEKVDPKAKTLVQDVSPSALVTQEVPLKMQQLMLDAQTVPTDAQALTAGSSLESQNTMTPLFSRTPAVGTYPTQKGKVLVTADFFAGLIPTGHAGMVYDGGRYSETGVIESLINGVVTGRNDFHDRYLTCFGLDVNTTSNTQEAGVANWCYRNLLGRLYNWDFANKETYNRFYCSQLVWRGILTLQV